MSAALLVSVPAALASTTFKWSGGDAKGSRGWANFENWEGGSAPSSSEPMVLEFPQLTSANCTASTPVDTCYESENNVSGLDVESMQVEDSQTYVIAGEPITLGSGGLSVAPATNTTEQVGSIMAMPVRLGTPQTWSIAGQSSDKAIDGNQFVLLEEVSGATQPLNITLSDGGGLVLVNEDQVGPLSFEGADPSKSGIFNGVVELFGAELNASDHESVSFNHIFVIGTGTIGPLTTNAAEIVVEPGEKQDERLEVQSATLDAKSRLTFAVTETFGTTAGRSYSQLAAKGPVDLDGAELAVVAADSCKPLWSDTSYTFLTSTGAITGSFGNASEGQEIPVEFPIGCPIEQTLKIHYERNGATQTVTGTVIPGPTSTTTLEASPAHPVTNQNVTLTATVQASAETPSGKIEFDDGGRPITGCDAALVAVGSSYTATCRTPLVASSESPIELSANFLPGLGVNIKGSFTTDDLAIGLGPTTTSLQVSPATSPVNQNVALIATLSPSDPGLVQPGGTVQFVDGGIPIGSCPAQPLQRGFLSTSLTAMCLLSYPIQGTYSITASYSGDPNFAVSSSPAQTLTVQGSQEAESLEEPEIGKAKLDSTSIPIQNRTLAVVKLTCQGASSCKGTLGLSVRETLRGKRGKKSVRSVGIGAGAFSIKAGKTASVNVRLNKAGQAILRIQKKGQIKATLKLMQGSGTTRTSIRLIEAMPVSKKKG